MAKADDLFIPTLHFNLKPRALRNIDCGDSNVPRDVAVATPLKNQQAIVSSRKTLPMVPRRLSLVEVCFPQRQRQLSPVFPDESRTDDQDDDVLPQPVSSDSFLYYTPRQDEASRQFPPTPPKAPDRRCTAADWGKNGSIPEELMMPVW